MTEKLTIRRIANVKINPAMIRERDHGLLTENILYCVAVMVLSTKRQHLPETNDEKPVLRDMGPVIRKPISTNSGLRVNLGFCISFFKSLFQIISSILFRASKHQVVDKKNIL